MEAALSGLCSCLRFSPTSGDEGCTSGPDLNSETHYRGTDDGCCRYRHGTDCRRRWRKHCRSPTEEVGPGSDRKHDCGRCRRGYWRTVVEHGDGRRHGSRRSCGYRRGDGRIVDSCKCRRRRYRRRGGDGYRRADQGSDGEEFDLETKHPERKRAQTAASGLSFIFVRAL